MRRFSSLLIYGFILITFAACAKTEQPTNNTTTATTPSANASPATTPPANIVTANVSEVKIAPGGSAEASVQVNIADGYHINGNPASKYQIATTLEAEGNEGITPGAARYPPSISKKFSFSPDSITVYESQATIKLPLKAETAATKGRRSLSAKLRVQPCDDQACYPPRSIAVSVPVVVE